MEDSGHRLDSWKEIADYLGRDVRTAARWAARRGLPVRRVPGGGRQSVFAYRGEIDAWLKGSSVLVANDDNGSFSTPDPPPDGNRWHTPEEPTDKPPPPTASTSPAATNRHPRLLAVLLAGIAILLGGVVFWQWPRRAPEPVITRVVQLTDDGLPKRRLVTDGKNVYFNEVIDGKFLTLSVPAIGGPIRRIDTPFTISYLLNLSADGEWLLVVGGEGGFVESGPLWMISTLGASPRRVGSVICHGAAFSPDAKSIIYATGSELWVVDSTTFVSRKVATLQGSAQWLKWSPDGSRIVFSLRDGNTAKMTPWMIDVSRDGKFGPPVALTKMGVSPCCTNWSWTHDSRFLFFGSPRLVEDDAEYDNEPWITRNSSGYSSPARQVSTGIKAVHASQVGDQNDSLFLLGGSDWHYQLVQYNVADDKISPYLPQLSVLYLSFSADREWVAYVRPPDNTLWRSRVDGSDTLQLTSEPMFAMLPAWSPNGKLIAFSAKVPNKPSRVYTVSRDGGAPSEVSVGSDNQGGPTWSPDGKYIYYANFLCAHEQSCAVHSIDLQSGSTETIPDSQGLRTARLSPDGKQLAALNPDQRELRLYNFQSKTWKTLASNDTGDNLNWSRDSQSLFYDKTWGDNPAIIRVRVSDGRSEVILPYSMLPATTAGYVRWFGLDPDDSPIVATAANYFEIYRVEWHMK